MATPKAPVVGGTVGAYQLDEPIGSDELGAVHRGHDVESGQRVLVRLLPPNPDDPDAGRHFEIELSTIARLDHPNILPVLAWGIDGGACYAVTEDADGVRLADRLAAGDRPVRSQAMAILAALARAIDYAHSFGVVHGDVSPSAVVLAPDGTPRLTDIGLGPLVPRSAPTGSIPPERLRGEPPTPGGDVYSFAALARELLRGGSGHAGALPRGADDVLRRGMAERLEDRWATCGEVVQALAALPEGRPSWAGQLRLAAGIGAVVCLAALLSAVLAGHVIRTGATPSSGALAQAPAVRQAPGTLGQIVGASPSPLPSAGTPAPAPMPSASATTAITAPAAAPMAAMGMVAAPMPPRMAPSLRLGSPTARPGQPIQLHGAGFAPWQQYQVTLQQGGRRWVLQGPTPARPDGTFSDQVQVPGNAAPGMAIVAACAIEQGRPTALCASQQLTIVG